ncbi:fimbrial protein [Enterobacter sp. KBR-315C3_2022]|jgi:P pilus assembly protein, pilin FimA|uniref:fimbrial protein n=1 Tax=Enterobacter sp. KBR-315C3_2022 TaxID=3242494 RepID=UPI0035272784
MKKTVMVKSLAAAVIMAAGISSAFAATSGATSSTVQGGTVEFKGSVVDAACAVSSDTVNQVVNLGQVRLAQLTGKDAVANQKTPFAITLADCDSTVSKQASITFDGTAAADEPGVLDNTAGAGSASGVGIQIYDKDGSALDLGTASQAVTLIDGNNNLNFSADYIQTADTATAGNVDTTATFNITYQ